MHFFQSPLIFKISIIIVQHFCFRYIWSKMLSSSLFAMLKLSPASSSQKLFDNDYVTLYYIKYEILLFYTSQYPIHSCEQPLSLKRFREAEKKFFSPPPKKNNGYKFEKKKNYFFLYFFP